MKESPPPRPTRRLAVVATVALLAAFSDEALSAGAEAWLRVPSRGDVVVSTAAEFRDALGKVEAGGTISLRPGDYEKLSIRGFRRDDYVVIRSTDPERPARIGALDVADSERLWFQQLRFAWSGTPAKPGAYIVKVLKSRDIGIVASEFHGLVDDDYANDPKGISVRDSEGMVFAANRLHHLARGLVAGGVRRARISGNHFFDLRSDGADFAGVQDVVIDGNLFTTFHPAAEDHADFIQFWQRNALIEDTRRVVIRGNTFLQGTGAATQTIFVGNKIKGRVYRDFVIEDNVIYNAHPHGITLYDLDGGRVANNTLVTVPNGNADFPGGKYEPRINLYRVRNVVITANVAPRITQRDTSGITLQQNLFTEDATIHTRRHPVLLFVDPYAGPKASSASFTPRPGGLLDRPGNDRIGAIAAESARQ